VTKIPPEHPAAKSLEHSFRALGEERARERGQSRRRRRPAGAGRVALAAATSVLVVAGAATGTKVFLGDGGTVDPDTQGLQGVGGRIEPAPDDRQLAQATTTEPAGGQPWGVGTYKSAQGDTCLVLGRVVGGRLGVIREGRFRQLTTRTGGLCAKLGADHAVFSVRDYYHPSTPSASRGVLYGIVDRTVQRVHLRSPQGRTTEVAVAADATFVVVRRGTDPFHLTQLVFDGSAGRQVRPLG
jgi:hypothetical protein